MSRVRQTSVALAALLAVAVGLAGCPLEFRKEDRPNLPPTTFFDVPFRAEPDTVFRNERFFRWIGTDGDSDVVAYQYQLVQVDSTYFARVSAGEIVPGPIRSEYVVRFIDPPVDAWSSRTTDNFRQFVDLDDAFYEMRARAIDNRNQADPEPARKLFFVFFDDIAPVPIIGIIAPDGSNNQMCGRLGGSQSKTFLINASDQSRNATTRRSQLQWRVQLRANSLPPTCTQHIADPFTDWENFPDDSNVPLVIGELPPTIYNDLFPQGCAWTFALQVRDPAGNPATATCIIEQL